MGLLDPQTAKLVQSIEAYMENPPRDMPDGLGEQLTELAGGLRGYQQPGEELSPGQREAQKAGVEVKPQTQGTGESYKKVLNNEEKSPGQREWEAAMNAAKEAIDNATPPDPAPAAQ